MNRDLARRVAEKLGWTELERFGHPEIGRLQGKDPAGGHRTLPQWPTDMNAAMKLWRLCKGWLMSKHPEREEWRVITSFGDFTAPTPAEAICLAFLGEQK